MKQVTSISLIIAILLICSNSILAQDNKIGFEIGYGKTAIEDYVSPLVLPFNKYLSDFMKLGFYYYFYPNKAKFKFKSGLTYDYRGQDGTNFNYLRVPVGIDFNFGKKVQLIVGVGFYISYLISDNFNYDWSKLEESKKGLQFGWQANIGLGYQISPRYKLTLAYQNNLDITKMYEHNKFSMGGLEYYVDVKGYDGFIKIGLIYNLLKE